jgi:hypothetical protein
MWLVEEVLTSLCLFFNHENGDFSILMRDAVTQRS